MTAFIGRREFITLLGGAAAAWPLAAQAQQTAMPVVGFLRNTVATPFVHLVTELGKGLSEEGFVEGRNVIIEQRWGDNQPNRLPGLAVDLVRRKAAVIVGNTPAVLAAVRVAGPTVPLVFVVGDDPVKSGLVASLSRPEGNLTGVTFFGGSLLGAKRLAMLQELVPKISVVAVLLDPEAAFEIELVETAARALGLQIVPVKLASEGDLEAAFDRIVATGAGALLFGGGPVLRGQIHKIVALAARHARTDDLRIARLRRGRRPDQLCGKLPRCLSPGGSLCRPHPQGRQAIRIAGPATDQIRDGDQSQDRQGARHQRPTDIAGCSGRGARVKRREFIAGLAGAAAWPLAAQAQQPEMPVIGFLNATSPDGYADRLRGFRQGLRDAGYVEGENVAIEYRWADNQTDRLPTLAAELVRRRVAVIAAPGDTNSVLAAKAATTTIPIVFAVGGDPVGLALVASLARPGGNLTGVNFFNAEITAKRLELLRELVPAATRVAVLVNPTAAAPAETTMRDAEAAARAVGLQVQALNARNAGEIDAVFAPFVHERPDALFVDGGALFNSRRVQLVHLATRHALPASYGSRAYPEIGGLMSYGTSIMDGYRQVGLYTGRILRGAKPADLPVVQANKFELVINAQTARTLGLTVPASLLARADEVIE